MVGLLLQMHTMMMMVHGRACSPPKVLHQYDIEQLILPTGGNCTSFDRLEIAGSEQIDVYYVPITYMIFYSVNTQVPRHIDYTFLQQLDLSGSWSSSKLDPLLANFSIAGRELTLDNLQDITACTIPSSLKLTSFSLLGVASYPLSSLTISPLSTESLQQLTIRTPTLSSPVSIITNVNCSVYIDASLIVDMKLVAPVFTSIFMTNTNSLQTLYVRAHLLGTFFMGAEFSRVGANSLDMEIDVVHVYGTGQQQPRQYGLEMRNVVSATSLYLPRLETMTTFGLTLTRVTNLTMPSLLTVDAFSVVSNRDGDIYFPPDIQWIGDLSVSGPSNIRVISFGGLRRIKSMYIYSTQVESIYAPSLVFAHGINIMNNVQLSSIQTSSLMVMTNVYITGPTSLNVAGFRLKSTGNFQLEAGNVTGLQTLRTLQCSSSQVSIGSCCPDLTTFTGDCFTPTSIDCHDCVTWTSISPSSGPVSGGQIITLTYTGVVKGIMIIIYFNDNEDGMSCSRTSTSDGGYCYRCITPPADASMIGNVTLSLVNGRSLPIVLPWTYEYVNWHDWAPVAADQRSFPYSASPIPGLPVDRSNDASNLSHTIIISSAIAFGVLFVIAIVIRLLGSPQLTRRVAGFDSLVTPYKVADPSLATDAYRYSHRQTNLGAFFSLATIMVVLLHDVLIFLIL
jgi:hypothetical protein